MKLKPILRKIHRLTPEGKLKEIEKRLYKQLEKKTPKDEDIKIKKSGDVYRGEGPSETWHIPNNEKQKFRWCVNFLETHERFMDIIEPNHTIIEVGAATGEYTLPAAEKLESGKLYAIEPEAKNFECLKKNIESSSKNNILPFRTVFSDKEDETVKLNVDKSSIADHSLNPKEHSDNFSHDEKDYSNSTIEKTKTVEKFCREEEIKHVDILKITVNAHELEVLRGAEAILDNVDRIILNLPYDNVTNFLKDKDFYLKEKRSHEAQGEAVLFERKGPQQ
jgi:FkbM family methyltransferase